MPEVTKHEPGAFSGAELATSDSAGATATVDYQRVYPATINTLLDNGVNGFISDDPALLVKADPATHTASRTRRAASSFPGSSAGMPLRPPGDSPSVSMTMLIVLAVNWPGHAPALGRHRWLICASSSTRPSTPWTSASRSTASTRRATTRSAAREPSSASSTACATCTRPASLQQAARRPARGCPISGSARGRACTAGRRCRRGTGSVFAARRASPGRQPGP